MLTPADVCALIPAYNAAATIERAIRSVAEQVGHIIVVDDGSTDGTADFVEGLGLQHLTLVKQMENHGVGHARTVGLALCRLPLIMSVDADDMALSGRTESLLAHIERGADFVYDAAELHDGQTDTFIRNLPIAGRLFGPGGLAYQVARNYIPSIGWPMARTSVLQKLNYDETMRHAEDYHLFMRALLDGAQIALSESVTYRQYSYPGSLSRQLEKQQAGVKQTLKALGLPALYGYLERSGLPENEISWIKACLLCRIEEWEELAKLCMHNLGTTQGREAAFMWNFMAGTAHFYLDDLERAEGHLRTSLDASRRAENLNNLGVLERLRGAAASGHFTEALGLRPEYLDARENAAGGGLRWTSMPLRTEASRDDYRSETS